VEMAYDDRDNVIEDKYFGIDDKRIVINDGYARLTMTYDERSQLIGEAHFGLDYEPVLYDDTYARWAVARNPQGELVTTYYGVDGEVIGEPYSAEERCADSNP